MNTEYSQSEVKSFNVSENKRTKAKQDRKARSRRRARDAQAQKRIISKEFPITNVTGRRPDDPPAVAFVPGKNPRVKSRACQPTPFFFYLL